MIIVLHTPHDIYSYNCKGFIFLYAAAHTICICFLQGFHLEFIETGFSVGHKKKHTVI